MTADHPSRAECGDRFHVPWSGIAACVPTYLSGGGDADDPRASPLRASELAGVAPAVIATMELDPLRDEGNAYAARLDAAGTPVVHREYPHLPHAAFDMIGCAPAARRALADTLARFGSVLAGHRNPARDAD